METVQRNDAMLIELMTEKQSIVGFFEAIFGFLSRWYVCFILRRTTSKHKIKKKRKF